MEHVCKNPNCKNYGHAHPNCNCYAHGGPVDDFCEEARSHHPDCQHFVAGGPIEDPGALVDHAAAHHGLLGLMTKPDALAGSRKGYKHVQHHAKRLMEKDKADDQIHPEKVDELHAHLEDVAANPHKLMEVPGGENQMPAHSAQLGSSIAVATAYLQGIKPQPTELGPMQRPAPPSPMAQARYRRQLGIAQAPLTVIQHAKAGTLQPADVTTLDTIYPKLAQSMRVAATEAIATAQAKGEIVPYAARRGLSVLLGQPLDFTMTPTAMQAIMAAQGPQQAQQQGTTPASATSAEISAVQKDDKLYETPQESRLINRKD